jgi:hypothetical protein
MAYENIATMVSAVAILLGAMLIGSVLVGAFMVIAGGLLLV